MYPTTHFPKAKKYWHMGKLYDWSEAHLHPMNHALHYGTSVFEGIRAYKTAKGAAVFRLPEHINRFFHSASVVRMKVPYSRDEIIEAIKLTMRENQLEAAYIRPLLFYAYGNMGLVPKHCPVELVVATWEWGAYLGAKADTGVSTYILPWRRVHHSQLDMSAKLGGLYILSAIYGMEARELGYDEAIFLNIEGNIAEGPGENIFIVKSGVLKTNSLADSILEGITRTSILEIAKEMGIKTVVGSIRKEELFEADEAFFTGTAAEISPITSIVDGSDHGAMKNEYIIGSGQPGDITTAIKKTFKDAVGGGVEKFEKWLTYVNKG